MSSEQEATNLIPFFNFKGYHVCHHGIAKEQEPNIASMKHDYKCDHIPKDEFALCKTWIQEKAHKTKRIYDGKSSYGYKHDVERDVGQYIGNGAFIAAALELGYRVSISGNLNCYFNLRTTPPKYEEIEENLVAEIRRRFNMVMPDWKRPVKISWEFNPEYCKSAYEELKCNLPNLPKVLDVLSSDAPAWDLHDIAIHNGRIDLQFKLNRYYQFRGNTTKTLYDTLFHRELLDLGYELRTIRATEKGIIMSVSADGMIGQLTGTHQHEKWKASAQEGLAFWRKGK